jgi:hypothetical protein
MRLPEIIMQLPSEADLVPLLANSLLDCVHYSGHESMKRYYEAYAKGHMTMKYGGKEMKFASYRAHIASFQCSYA